ncbi:MAG: hypothetical protein NVS9B7_04830 [Flavisolibacter sp.]
MNVNGIKGPEVFNIDIASNDSAYIFLTAILPVSGLSSAFMIRDSLVISYNGNKKWVQLDALGQNAHIYKNKIVTINETWANDLPYVIYGSLTIADSAMLMISKGCHIYIHADAPFIIKGSLQALGEPFDSTKIIFSGDRLDDPYVGYPASYPGLLFTASSKNNRLSSTIIKNAYQGITISGSSGGLTQLNLNEVVIDNIYDVGIQASHSTIVATNLLLTNCSRNLVITNGGNYTFTHCTVSTYSNNFIQHKDPIIYLSNSSGLSNPTPYDLKAVFLNCILWAENNGFVPDEIVAFKDDRAGFSLTFDHVLWRQSVNPSNSKVTSSLNLPPLFDSINTLQRYYSFKLKNNSPALKAGVAAGVPIDLAGAKRPMDRPDLGCYQQ